jgi:glycosyltransferase involved in cell wall biosynthesis
MNEVSCLNPVYSTTRLVVKKSRETGNNNVLTPSINQERKNEGGLRNKGYYKKSYTNKPLITVITAVFNGYKFLEESIKSVINQSYENIEYLIIDGGSNDGTLDIIKEYNDVIDYWVSERDDGIYDALNKALLPANGDWIYVLGSDDRLYPDALEKVASYLKEQNIIYYGNVRMLSDGRIFDGPFSRYKLMYCNISHQSIFYPRRYIHKNSYNIKYKSAADFEMILRCQGNPDYKIFYIPVLVAEYNDLDGISSRQEDQVFLADKKKIIKENFPLLFYLLYALRHYTVLLLKYLGIKDAIKKKFFRKTK